MPMLRVITSVIPNPARWTAQNEPGSTRPSPCATSPATSEPGIAIATRAPAMPSQATVGERAESRCARGGRISAAAEPITVEQISAIANRTGTDDQPTRKPVTIANSAVPTVVTVRIFSTDPAPTRTGSGSAAVPARGTRRSRHPEPTSDSSVASSSSPLPVYAWSTRLGLPCRRQVDIAKPRHLERFGRETPAHCHAAGERRVELDADRDDTGALAPSAGAPANFTETIVRMGPVFSGRSGSGWRSNTWPGYTDRIALWCTSL